MDERHWWIAGKIQESFHIGGYDNPTLLEDFMCEPDTLDMINEFLGAGGPRRIFFYCDKPESGVLSTRQLHITDSLGTLKDVNVEEITILYFLRHHVRTEVDATHMEKDVFCGELKGNTIDNLTSLLTEIYMPIFRAQKDWGQCTQENQQGFVHNIDKFISSLIDSSTSSQTSKQWMLKHPDNIIGSDFKQHRLAAHDQQIIAEYEQLVTDWMTTIESILTDTSDERFMDPNAGPLSELDRWRRRQRLLTSLTEQLKGKECKSVIHILITAKSRLMKRWKLIDSAITDAMNETKDKVRYLESMKRFFDQLYNGATPSSIINTALPGIVTSIKQMDSVSRFYARQGFLGLLFTKITNQLVLSCKEYIKEATISDDNDDFLWTIVLDEIRSSENPGLQTDPQQKHIQTQLMAKLKGFRMKNKENKTVEINDETLISRLKACLTLQSHYRDTVRGLRDALGASYNLSRNTSISSLGPPSISTARSKKDSSSPSKSGRVQPSPVKKGMSLSGDSEGHGVSVADEETIMGHLDTFCVRLRQVLDVVNTMAQLSKMVKTTTGLPRPRSEDLVYDEAREEVIRKQQEKEQQQQQQQSVTRPPQGADHSLDVIREDDEPQVAEATSKESGDSPRESTTDELGDDEDKGNDAKEEMKEVLVHTGLTKSDVDLLKKYYPDHRRNEGPSVGSIVSKHVDKMSEVMMQNVTTKTMLDVESKDRDRFDEFYNAYLGIVQELEQFLAAYLNAIFARKMKTQEALQLMTKFVAIQQRPGVRVVIAEKFVEIFNWYEGDLDEMQHLYEKHKEEPPVLRNAPPVAGAIYWSRQLLRRIEEPMKIFRDNKAVTQLKDFSRVVKIYNRLATALVTFESLWFTYWKTNIDHARNGLKATLFVLHPDSREILVNADDKVIELIHEAKWLSRLGVQIPESAAQVLQQESRFKNYKDHLELCIKEFNEVCDSIPEALKGLFQGHVDKALQNFQPGLSTLAWNSMNIDAFLHQIHSGTNKLKLLVEQVNDIMQNKVEATIDLIRDMIFFDYKLAFSRSWPPQEFTQVMGDSIGKKSNELFDNISVIEMGIKESAGILTGKRMRSQQDTVGSPDQSSRDIMSSLKDSTSTEGKLVGELLSHYCDQIYEAILLATTRSLVTLAESSGCEGDIIRAASVLSTAPSAVHSPSPRVRSASASRATSATSERSRPVSVLSMLSNMTWTTEKSLEITYLQRVADKGPQCDLKFEVFVKFSIPNIIIEPTLDSIQTALSLVARNILSVPRGVQWYGADNLGEKFLSLIQGDEVVNQIMAQINSVVDELHTVVRQHIFHFSLYDFLWKDDMQGNYADFIRHEPGLFTIKKEVERLLKIEKKVLGIPDVLPVGSICLHTDPVKNALHGYAMAWKTKYASVLHEEAKKKLDAAVLYRTNVRQRLELTVANLDQLNSTLHLLEEVRDMENKIDEIYLPIETMYAKLREFDLRLPRSEVEEVDQLRNNWQELLELADNVTQVLLKDRRGAFEQELDKQVKTFVVEVIQFRNAFDAQGPAVPGIPPSEAVQRLHSFQQRYTLYNGKRKTLDSVAKLFGIISKPFPELDKTGEELELLGLLYGLFQKFIRFDEKFKDCLWADVDLGASNREVESYWDECLALPSKLKDWDAYNEMKGAIHHYLDVFPLLHKLASKDPRTEKEEIRNRHWLQVMSVTGSSFQLEANVFKLYHLLDIGLIKHRSAIEEICRSASRELELEVKLRVTEEEWTEQVLNFEPYKRRGPMYLDKAFTERLLEQLEDAQALLAQMLTSRYIGPLREEAASWAEKLKEVAEVLEQWLEVQDLWQYLEAVFSNSETAKELPQEAKRFSRIDKGWTKMMKRAYDTRNVLQCCYGGEVPKGVVLRHIYEELEICFKSLMGYLDKKRRAFPRFYFVSDPVLLALLSRPADLDSVKPHLRTIFSAVYDVQVERAALSDSDTEADGDVIDHAGRRSTQSHDRSRQTSVTPHHTGSTTPPPKIDKRLAQIHHSLRKKRKRLKYKLNMNPHLSQHMSTTLPSELLLEDSATLEAVAIQSIEGETLVLQDKVALIDGVEVWLNQLRASITTTLRDLVLKVIEDCNQGIPPDEWVKKYPAQVCRFGMLYYWTKECELGVAELKYDRKALNNLSRKFGTAINKLPTLITRGMWKNIDEVMTPVHKIRLERMVTYALFLRDTIDNMAGRKLREATDFEWRRCLRCYMQELDERVEPVIMMLDQQYTYGCEFYGAQPIIGLTPLTDKCFLSMSQAIAATKGSMLTGATGTGKTETAKGFAQTLGNFLVMFQCSPSCDPSALGKLLQGMAMDGCWGCLDDIQQLQQGALATLLDHVQAVYSALHLKQAYCFMNDGQQVPINKRVAMMMTFNPDTSLPSYHLPNDIRANFRQVALVKPDSAMTLKAKCSSLGLKSPSVLALRLKLVAELSRDQLPEEVHHNFSVAAMTGVLQRAAQKRRFVREEKSMEKIDRPALDKRTSNVQSQQGPDNEGSRSNSQQSVGAPSQLPLQGQTSSALIGIPSTTGGGKTGRKSTTPNPLSATAKVEHAIVGQTLINIIGPRLSSENLIIFRQVVRDVFQGLPDSPPQPSIMSAHSRSLDVEAYLEATAVEGGNIPHKPWMEKCMQLYNISQAHQGIIVAGPPGSGKSTIVQTLVDALCVSPRGLSRNSSRSRGSDLAETNHKLQKLYPLVVDDLSLMFGHLNHNHDWVDGIFTSAWRKASRNQSTTWLSLDGPLNPSWVDTFSSVLDVNKVLNLANGDKLFLSNNIKMIFETDNLKQASPSLVARTGILFVDKTVVGWKPIARAWLENRSQQEVRVLTRAFDKTLDPVSNFVANECKPKLKLSEVGMFKTCLNLLSAMLSDNVEIGGELHIERLYLFCLMWSFGGLLEEKDRNSFNSLLGTLSTALPDDDRDICFFDYYVDESGEWDPWQSRYSTTIDRVPEGSTETSDFLGEVFVDTVDTIRTRLLMDFACAGGQNVLLVGPHGSGKTTMVNDFLNAMDPQAQIMKKLVYSGSSTAKQLQNFIEANIYHRQGFVYGAKENKKMQLFIDDLNLPVPDEYGVQRGNELLRRMLDDRILCTLQRPFEWRTIEGLQVCSTMSMSEYPSMNNRLLTSRLLRHFAVIHLPGPQDDSLQSIVHGVLDANMLQNDHPGLDIDVHNTITQASCRMLSAIKDVLRPTPLMPGRKHYLFTLKDLVTCFQCLKRLPDESRADERLVVSLWRHEIIRIMKDRICRHADHLWFDETLQEITNEYWSELAGNYQEHFVTFPTDARVYQRPVTSMSKKEIKVVLQPVDDLVDVHNCLQTHLNRYNEEFGNIQLDILLSNHVIGHILKMHRILSFHHGGNFVLVGPIGAHLATLCQLALHVADIPIHSIDTSKQNTFLDGLRSAVRLTGAEGKKLTLLFTAAHLVEASGRDLHEELYLDAINSLLVSGEYPHLFSNDEMEGLLQALGPALKREHPNVPNTDMSKYFVSRVKTNLHIIICLAPTHKLLDVAASQYPGLLSGCQIIWMCDWEQEALLGHASYYLNKLKVTSNCETDLSDAVALAMSNIYNFVLTDCRQTKWAGDTSDDIQLTQVKVHEKKKDQLKMTTLRLPNRPYSKAIMMDNIKLRHRNNDGPSVGELYIGPTTYSRFMDTFQHLYSQKAKERTESVNRLKRVIATLDQTRKDGKTMKDSIKTINKKYETAKERTVQLLAKLTGRATVLEKLKAQVGIANALSAFLQLNELSDDEEEDDELLKEEERDEYDDEFERMREANLQTRQVQAKEEYADALKTLEECRKNLAYAKEQVLHWKGRVDRSSIERLRGFQNPTMLVGQVMEMVMILIGKRLPNQQRMDVREYPMNDLASGRFSTSSASTKFTVSAKKKPRYQTPTLPSEKSTLSKKRKQSFAIDRFTGKPKDPSERFDRQSWKSMQLTMNDSVKFVDMLHNVPWEDGLPKEVTSAVEGYLAQARDGSLGVTGEGTLLENAAEKEKNFVAVRRSPSPENSKGITIAAAKYSSEDCATLVQYTIAIVEYTRLCGPLRAAIERMHELEREIEENERMKREKEEQGEEAEEDTGPEPEEDLTEDDLPRIQNEVDDLQAQFDASVVEKHSLQIELQSMKERLKAAFNMIDSLHAQEVQWREYVADHSNNDMLVANCITAAAFLIFCAPMNTDSRRRIGEYFMNVCEAQGLPLPSKQLCRNLELVDFLYKPLEMRELEQLQLPMTRVMMENASFVMQGESTLAWPLLCDPTSRVIDWTKSYLKTKGLVEVKYNELRSQFDTCLADGFPLLVTDVDVVALATDQRFFKVIHSRKRFIPGKNPFKIMVGDHEVECQPHFRLYLHTTSLPHEVPPELAAYVSLIYFHQTRVDVEEELLDRFMTQEKSRLQEEKTTLLQERLVNMHHLHELEQQMIQCLSSDVRLLNELTTTKKLAELKKQYDETQEGQQRVDGSEESITRAREGFRVIAQRGAVCFDTTQYLREINPLYYTSINQFLTLYDSAISHSDRAPVKTVVERLTYNVYVATTRYLIERDRPLYSLLLALEVEDSLGNTGLGEREYLISPTLGSATMTAAGYTQPPDSKFVQAKKAFDWMTEDQFNNLQILAIHYEWFQEMFDRMPKDGRETQWRTLCESDQPEIQQLPDKMDDQYTALQRLLVVRAVRNDRLTQASLLFIQGILGKKYLGEVPLDLPSVLKASSPSIPILLLFTSERESAEKLFTDFAYKKQAETITVVLSGMGTGEEKMARKSIHKAMEAGEWVLLQNGHMAPNLLSNLESVIAEQTQVDPQFRCWITAEGSNTIPPRVLQTCLKVMIDTPRTIKDTMVRSFNHMQLMEIDVLKHCSRQEWCAVLHNLCYLHGALRLRARFGRGGWNAPQDFLQIGNMELHTSMNMMMNEFRDNLTMLMPDGQMMPRNTSWTGIRFLLAEVIYGNYVTDPVDQQSLCAMIDYWMSPNAVKKDFELPKLKYKLPGAFFATYPRLSQLIQGLENIQTLEVPEACNIHTSSETILGDDQYIFTRLNKVFDAMPSSATLSHHLYPRAPSPFDAFEENILCEAEWAVIRKYCPLMNNSHIITDANLVKIHYMASPPIAGVSTMGHNQQVVDHGVFASSSYAMLKMRREVELWEICHTMLAKVPRAYSKEYVSERVKKIGGNTPFNLFIMKELDIMCKLLVDIKSTLQIIKGACEISSLGDQLSAEVLSVADDLFHMRIPGTWCRLAGTTAPPANHSLANWLTDLQNRSQHFERILVLGREKMPAYWLGAFFYPRGLLALLKQECYRHHGHERAGNIEPFVFQTEITARDKDHIRDPPSEGMFVFGIYLWECAWEKTTGDLQDAAPRHSASMLPVIHLTCWPQGEKPLLQDPTRAAEVYPCPVYQSRIAPRNPIIELDLYHAGVPATRWALRGLSATVRPY